MGGKRKQPVEYYCSRGALLSKSKKPRNVSANITLVEANQKIGCQERRFSRKLVLPSDPDSLVAIVQMNDICMMVAQDDIVAEAVKYEVSVSQISGKKKKVPGFHIALVLLAIRSLLRTFFRELPK